MTLTGLPIGGGPVIPDFGKPSSCVANNGTFCSGWFTEHWSSIFQPALIQHIELSALAVAVGFAISFFLAVVAHRARWLVPPVTFATSLLYTIPSLTAFEILVPITGLSRVTVEIPLIAYTLLDAARGIGLTTRQTLWRVELPLALPTIFAGLRVAIVTTISLATIAAFITPLGLGQPIFDALSKGNFNTELVGAGVLAILIALAADFLLVGVQRVLTPWAHSRRPV